ncbi:FtsX-like permease family protein [Rubrivirga sp. S365]|uniref:FtsX-like permease family protein n=1 Tax=Rubrivirga litoralis TaxID=3075598 RepID=A0ABU3BR69_9BACT|nr:MULTISPECIES: FtsX-like permease family protein [unclassified Rubrivirga]MDT0631785.1 FtsX-like permease family protein [Rubrivirga sp. F394]MDT7856523.1 FtsX-like permease family protein [Rubrivirga sp. S365]
MDYRLLIARRYLASRRRVTLISVISGISVAGVALGVAALVVVLSVMNGFYDVVRDLLVSYDPHVRVEAADGRGLESPDSLVDLARGLPGVVSAAPYVEGKALLTTDGGGTLNQVVVVRGVDARALDAEVERSVRDGSFDLERRGGAAGVVMGGALAARSGVYAADPGEADAGGAAVAGSRVTLLSAQALERAVVQYPFGLPDQRAFTVRGTFELEPTYDETHVFVALDEAQRLFGTPGLVTGVDLRLDDLDDAPALAEALQGRLDAAAPGRFRVQTWADLQGSLYSVMRLEKWAASAILGLIIVVAAFNIVGALTMIVIEKRRDLGALQAMGASRRDVRRIFLLEGLLVGGVGTGIGLAVGLSISLAQQAFGIVKLAEAGSFVIDAYPVAIRLVDVGGVAVAAVGLCALAAVYPASRAAHVDPARAVQSGA